MGTLFGWDSMEINEKGTGNLLVYLDSNVT